MEKKSFSRLLENIQENSSIRGKDGLSFEEMTPEEKKKTRRNGLITLLILLGVVAFVYSPWRTTFLNWAYRKYLYHQICADIYGVYGVQFKVQNLSSEERQKFLETLKTGLLTHQKTDVRLRLVETLELCYADAYFELIPTLEQALAQESDLFNQEKLKNFLYKIKIEQYLESISWVKSLWNQGQASVKKNYKHLKNFFTHPPQKSPQKK